MLEKMIETFTNFFSNLSIIGIGLVAIFTCLILSFYWPPLFKKWKLWGALAAGALFGLLVLSFVQFPLGKLFRFVIHKLWSSYQLQANILLIGSISVLIGGLTQEGAKMVSVLLYQFFDAERDLTQNSGLIIGACVGAGFGFLEAQWALNQLFSMGWSWQVIEIYGILGLAAFWERFFAIAGHIAMGALGGLGLAKGKWFKYWLMVAIIHALINMSAYIYQAGLVSAVVVEIYLALAAILLSFFVLRLRWKKETRGIKPKMKEEVPNS